VSVILPVYNGQNTINQAVDSILEQSFRNFELLVINDGSTDSSRSIVSKIRDPRLTLITNTHRGLTACLNSGISAARGKYIARMDADDISISDRFKLQVEYMESNPQTGVLATNVRFKGSSASEGLRHYVDWQNKLMDHQEIFHNRFVDCPLIHPSVMIRRSSFMKFGCYQETQGPEDFELWLRWLDQGAIFHKLQEELLVWVDGPNRLTRINDNYKKEKFFHLKARYYSKWLHQHKHEKANNIWVLGSGSTVFHRTRFLKNCGVHVQGYIDFKPNSSLVRKVISYDDIPSLKNPFFLSYVSDRTGRQKIKEFLQAAGFIEGQDFYMMA